MPAHSPSPSTAKPDHQTLEEAAEWFALLSDDQCSNGDRQAWQQWFDSSPQHRIAWQYVEQVSKRFHQVAEQTSSEESRRILGASRSKSSGRRRVLGSGLAVFGALLAWRYSPLSDYSERLYARINSDESTGVGEIRKLALTDGGTLWINTDSALKIDYQAEVRRIHLQRGELQVQTGYHDTLNRPFLITTEQGQLRALGTRFSVRRNEDETYVAVFEGAVEITTEQGERQRIDAGQQTRFSAQQIDPPKAANPAHRAWASGLILADNIPLSRLVAELRRYRHGHLGLDPAIADLRVVGSFPAENPDHALAMLADSLPLRINRHMSWWVTLEANTH
ncbi:FecR domain-containing protein [Marinobacterium mangrovicola]|uniref:FecR family protein n=1 Tax=Marinobacterium mangrovicola TaxID=1476959 RepID=A0A4R1G6K4_9GAMM|nr:FecR domain-containing protein [Marinobacterium mangrovicola]TCK03677.1 FecR family protein [Marinobacterium mangrovicola]